MLLSLKHSFQVGLLSVYRAQASSGVSCAGCAVRSDGTVRSVYRAQAAPREALRSRVRSLRSRASMLLRLEKRKRCEAVTETADYPS